jgi:hypothetical protein
MGSFITEAIQIAFLATLPLALITGGIYYRSFVRGLFSETSDPRALKEEIKRKKAERKAEKDKTKKLTGSLVHDKWFKFGGGFYGLMALITYIFVEIGEIFDFFKNFTSIIDFFNTISIAMIIQLIIESIKNFITAFTWFLYWGDIIDSVRNWLWLIGAYLGYMAGVPVAQYWFQKKHPNGLSTNTTSE